MSLQEIVAGGGMSLLIVLTLIQIAPIKLNPWSALAKVLGKAINADVLEKIEKIQLRQKETREILDEHIQADDERDADGRRQRILRFNSEIMKGENFSHEYFCDMLAEIDQYENYCEEHPEYKNNRAVMAIKNIKRVCEDHEYNNDFLK